MAVKKKKVTKKKPVKSRNGRLVNEEDEFGSGDMYMAVDDGDLTTINFETLTKEDLLREIQKVDRELLKISNQMAFLSQKRSLVFKGDSEAYNIKLRTLKQRSDLLFRCLSKVMPDKKSVEGSINLNHTDADAIPDAILAKIALGTVTDDELEAYGHLLLDENSNEQHH